MTNTVMIVPADFKAELEKVSLALANALQTNGIKTSYFQPINQTTGKSTKTSLDIMHVEHLLAQGAQNELFEEIVAIYEKVAQNADVVIVKGLAFLVDHPYANKLNKNIADALNAKIVILASTDQRNKILLTAQDYNSKNILGYIINKPKVSKAGIFKNMPRINMPFDDAYIKTIARIKPTAQVSTPLFRHQLIQRAHSAYKKILLPEGTEIRIIKAAAICARREMAECILMGNADKIKQIAVQNNIELSDNIKFLEPDNKFASRYIEPMVALRKHKGMTTELAKESLQDYIVLATMMLQQNDVDGVVAGAIHSSAHTVRPALQLIKTTPNVKAVSSIFFMCLPRQVLVYADCGVTLNPTAEELADIAIQTSETAVLFGIEPKIALLSYSTYNSGQGKDVEKVAEATKIIKTKRPDLVVDGPLQYDAAVNEEISKIKAPNSPIAGQATVCIFPDLDSGNIVYKAVQRSADIGSFGPILQGLRKPINDLSRGSTVEDIVFTIAITAIQSSFQKI